MMARMVGFFFPSLKAHALRVSGRASAAAGNRSRATRYFDKAIQTASQARAEYELARSRIDRSMLNHPTADNDRREGLAKIEALGCVLPDVELNYLGVDRVAHRNRAAEARSDDGVS